MFQIGEGVEINKPTLSQIVSSSGSVKLKPVRHACFFQSRERREISRGNDTMKGDISENEE